MSKESLKIVFFGTPHFAAEVLRGLLERHFSIVAVVTQPDRPRGRSGVLAASAVKEVALSAGLEVLQPERASQADFLEAAKSYEADIFVVVAFGQILPQKLLDVPRLGCINVHASLLPAYRGAAPMQRALMDGREETGVCVQKMVKQLDAGDVIAESRLEVPLEMTLGELQKRLLELTNELLPSVLREFAKGIPEGTAQNEHLVSFAPKITAEECQLDWTLPALTLHNKIRALSPRPGAWCWAEVDGEKKRVKILRSYPVQEKGEPLQCSLSRALVYCGEGALQLLEVQPEGKKAMPALDWLRGIRTSLKFLPV